MTWTILRSVALGVHRLLGWFVNGYLLHPKRRGKVLAAMALSLVCLVSYALVRSESAAGLGSELGAAPGVPVLEHSTEAVPQDREAYLMGRFWIDHKPRGDREPFHLYVFQENSVGAYITVESLYLFRIELFLFSVRNNTIELRFPHNRQRAGTPYRIMDERGRGNLNLKLVVQADPRQGGETRQYFSSLESPAELPPWLTEAVKRATREFGG